MYSLQKIPQYLILCAALVVPVQQLPQVRFICHFGFRSSKKSSQLDVCSNSMGCQKAGFRQKSTGSAQEFGSLIFSSKTTDGRKVCPPGCWCRKPTSPQERPARTTNVGRFSVQRCRMISVVAAATSEIQVRKGASRTPIERKHTALKACTSLCCFQC